MLDKVFGFISDNKMLRRGDTVVCGLSGGADSVCLLLALNSLHKRLGITVEAVHVNHCLRGDESDRDEGFCRELCNRLEIGFISESCDVSGYAGKNGLSCEEAARKLRYGIFAKHSQGKRLATAHNANDNLETMLLNLARGTALKGISGIPPMRGNIIRPMLIVSRSEIEAYLGEIGQSYVTDSTNLSDDYTRNKIRHRIIPLMEEINPSVVATAARSSQAMREENSFIESAAEEALKKCRSGNSFSGLSDMHGVIRRRCIAGLLTEKSLPYSYERLNELDNILINGGKYNLSGDIFFVSDGRSAEITTIPHSDEEKKVSAKLVIGENMIFPDKKIVCRLIECDNLKKIDDVHKNLTFYLLDYDKIKGSAIVRSRKYGDKIRLCGRSFNSSVKKLINQYVPAEKRRSLHFIEDSEGTVFAEMIGIADRVKPDGSTKRLLEITISSIR